MQKNILIGNWKMNHGLAQTSELCTQLSELSRSLKKTELKVSPSYLSVLPAIEAAKDSSLAIGLQNIHWKESGAFTGEVSPQMALEAGATFALIGHSERRQFFGENNNDVLLRTRACLDNNVLPVVCIGESLEEREGGKTLDVLKDQLKGLFTLFSSDEYSKKPIVIAYEPIWAIGTGKVPTISDIESTHKGIIDYWKSFSKNECAPILYGGSVKPDNFKEILAIDEVSGALVGGASLTFDSFSALASISED